MDRKSKLIHFITSHIGNYDSLVSVAGDASFRQYFRVIQKNCSYIIMDAPPKKEDAFYFVQIANAFAQAGVRVPEVIASDFELGFLLLSDFGDDLLFNLLKTDSSYLKPAIDELFVLQTQGGQNILELPEYNRDLLLGELALFRYWFVQEWLDFSLSTDEEKLLDRLFQQLIVSAERQPQVWVHRDYHSRNLLLTKHHKIGVIDFQDAVLGPITYDLVSLLKDCYIRYDSETLKAYLEGYYFRLVASDLATMEFDEFEKSFDYMGLQRHIKVLGIFTRLSIRDKKHGYLKDLELVFAYTKEVMDKYHELQPYRQLFNTLMNAMIDKGRQI